MSQSISILFPFKKLFWLLELMLQKSDNVYIVVLKRVTLHFYFSQVNIMLMESVQVKVSFEHVEKYFQILSTVFVYFNIFCKYLHRLQSNYLSFFSSLMLGDFHFFTLNYIMC